MFANHAKSLNKEAVCVIERSLFTLSLGAQYNGIVSQSGAAPPIAAMLYLLPRYLIIFHSFLPTNGFDAGR